MLRNADHVSSAPIIGGSVDIRFYERWMGGHQIRTSQHWRTLRSTRASHLSVSCESMNQNFSNDGGIERRGGKSLQDGSHQPVTGIAVQPPGLLSSWQSLVRTG